MLCLLDSSTFFGNCRSRIWTMQSVLCLCQPAYFSTWDENLGIGGNRQTVNGVHNNYPERAFDHYIRIHSTCMKSLYPQNTHNPSAVEKSYHARFFLFYSSQIGIFFSKKLRK